MPFKVEVGPPQIAIHHAQTVLITESNGEVRWPSEKGLYFLDTRVISAWAIYANGEEWDLLNGGAVTSHKARIHLTNRSIPTEDGTIPPRSLGLVIGRRLGGGMHEDLDITNHGRKHVRFNLEIAIRSDFADVFEVKQNRIVRRGRITTEWTHAPQKLHTTYRNQDFVRGVQVGARDQEHAAAYANGRLSFEVQLDPAATWHCCLLYELVDGNRNFHAPHDCVHQQDSDTAWQQTVLKIHSSNEEFYRCYRQAIEDMSALRLPLAGTDHMMFVPAAGLPWFMAPFGRDSLVVSIQNILIYPEFARGALDVLGRWQARQRDDYRDAEPGKIMHELRYGELAHFRLIPHTPYYGTADATALYLITLHAAWRATGDHALLERNL
ncbi:MAG TPA: glycogen debranching N-terminal domain-containing protein, partial [Acetobacteraceae bacterium]